MTGLKHGMRICAIGLLMALPAQGAWGQQADPGLDWRTLSSEHFNLHYPAELETTARRALSIAEDVHERLSPHLEWEPARPTEVVLMDQFDLANGMASPLPFNRMYLYLSPPDGLHTLADYDDWLELLITHEYTHTLHMDRAAGLPLGARKVLGRNPLLFPAVFNPTWLVEGLAVHQETDDESGIGRGQSTLFEMMMRMELASGFKPFDRVGMDGITRWPAGQTPYLYGAWFFRFLEDEYGPERAVALVRNYSNNIVPFLVNRNFRQTLREDGRWGPDGGDLWHRFRRWLEDRLADADAEAVGAYAGERLTGHGYRTGPARADGQGGVYYLRDDARYQPALMHRGGDGSTREVAELQSGARFDVHSDAGIVVAMPEICRNRNLYYDLYHVDPDRGARRRLTRCSRYRDAVWTPDGEALVATRMAAGRPRLDRLDARGSRTETLWEGDAEVVLGRMDMAPAGEHLVAAVWRAGRGWDLERFDLAAGEWTALTDDAAIEGDPRFTPAGDGLLFSSEHGGVFNLRRMELASGETVTLTQVPGGAFSPTQGEAGGPIFYVGYTGDGHDLFRLGGDAPLAAPVPGADDPAPPAPEVMPATGEARDYSPWSTLLPTTWLPYGQVGDSIAEVGVSISGMDALQVHQYSLAAGVELNEGLATGQANYNWANRFNVRVARQYDYSEGDSDGDDEFELLRARAEDQVETVWTLPLLRRDWQFLTQIGTSYTREHDRFVADGEPLFADATSGAAGVAFSYDSTRQFPRSVSASDGRRVRLLSESNEVFDSDFTGEVYRLDWEEYRRLGGEHVLFVRYTEAYGTERPRPFRVGGSRSGPAREGVFDQRHLPLRGYDTVERGRRARMAGAEWRFPIARPERAFTRFPLGVRQFSGRLFAEGGAAWHQGSDPAALRTAVGAELVSDLNLFYRFNLRLTLGFARGRDQGGERQFYLRLGSPLF